MIAALCLATVIYLEARSEPVHGQRWVADVVTMRAAKSRRSVCEVAAEPGQFAFRVDLRPAEIAAWKTALMVAEVALEEGPEPNGPTHFHKTTIRPDWTHGAVFFGRIKDHLFWRLE